MTILDVVNSVCDVVSLDQFDSVYGQNNPAAQTMLQLSKIGGKEIAQRLDWRRLQRTVIAASATVPFPDDYDRLIDGGAVMSAVGEFFRPVKSPSQWAVVKAVPSAQPYFYLGMSSIELLPLASAAGATVTYVTSKWIIGDNGEGKTDWSVDDDTVLFPERLLTLDLIWRWRRKQRLNFDDELAEFEAALGAESEEDRG